MQTTPANWEKVWNSGADVEFYAMIGGTRYEMNKFLSAKAYRAAFSSLAIGQAASCQLSISFTPLKLIPKAAKIEFFVRLTNQKDITTAWIKQGTYYIDHRDLDQEMNILSVDAFDRMIFAEEKYFSSGTITGTWPRSAPAVVSDICARLGISLDIRSQINSSLMVTAPVNLTMRDVLRNIAAAHGGNFIITAENKLRLLPLEDLPDITLLGDENGNFVSDEYGNRVLIIEGNFAEMICEKSYSTGDQVTVSGVTLVLDDEHGYTAGNSSGYTLTANCLYADQTTADQALSKIQGVRYNPAEVTGAKFNPLLELGDALYSEGNLFRVYEMEIDYDLVTSAKLSAPIDGDVEHEIPYQTSTERLVNWKAAQTRAYIDMGLEELELGVKNDMEKMSASINIQLTAITSRVQGAEGDISTLTQTANSLQTQITNARGDISSINQTVSSISTEIRDVEGDLSSIEQKVDNIRLSVSNGERSSWIDLMVNGIALSSEQIKFTGDVVFESDLSGGSTLISGDCIRTGQIDADYIRLGGKMELFESLSGGNVGGYFGYMEGQAADGTVTHGVGIMEYFGEGQFLCSNRGAKLGFGSSSAVTCTYSRVSLTGPEIVVNGTLKNSDGTVITSDRNAKEDIREDLDRYLGLFDRLRPASFRLKGRKRRHLGFIAQDVEASMREAGIDPQDFAGLVIDAEGGYGLRYEEFIPLLAAKVQRLEKMIKEMRA